MQIHLPTTICFYLLLTQTSMCCITAKKIFDSTAVVCILKNFRNNQCPLMTYVTLRWITWCPSIRWLWISFCWTVKSYTLLCCNFTYSFVFTSINCCWICRVKVTRKTKIIFIILLQRRILPKKVDFICLHVETYYNYCISKTNNLGTCT